MKVLMLVLLCTWGDKPQCTPEEPVLTTIEHCREQQKLYSTPDMKDHVYIQCIKQTCA